MLGYSVKIDDLTISVRGGSKSSPLKLSANAYTDSLKPLGLVVVEGEVYSSVPEGLPCLVAYKNGGVSVRDACSLFDVINARFIASGTARLLDNYLPSSPVKALNVRENSTMDRMGVGLLDDGRLLFLSVNGTFDDLQAVFMLYPVRDAIMLAYDDVYINDKFSDIEKGNLPMVVFEASNFDVISSPIVVIDAGHGGLDSGVRGFGVDEKDIALNMAVQIQRYLDETYVGTFILTRNKDVLMTNEERIKKVNALDADFLLSLHVNGATISDMNGFSSYINTSTLSITPGIRDIIHEKIADYLSSYGIVDKGREIADLSLLRDTVCPSIVLENLFITNPQNAKWLMNDEWVSYLCVVIADALAKALGLEVKMTTEAAYTPYVTYVVKAGKYTYLRGAEDMVKRLKQAGFDATISVEKTKKE